MGLNYLKNLRHSPPRIEQSHAERSRIPANIPRFLKETRLLIQSSSFCLRILRRSDKIV